MLISRLYEARPTTLPDGMTSRLLTRPPRQDRRHDYTDEDVEGSSADEKSDPLAALAMFLNDYPEVKAEEELPGGGKT